MKNNRNTHVSYAELDLISPSTFEHFPFHNQLIIEYVHPVETFTAWSNQLTFVLLSFDAKCILTEPCIQFNSQFELFQQLIFLAGSTDVSTEDISVLLSESNTTISVYTYSLLGGTSSNISAMDEHSVNRLKQMARTTNGKYEVSCFGVVFKALTQV